MDDSNPIPPSMNSLLQQLELAFQDSSLHGNGTSASAVPAISNAGNPVISDTYGIMTKALSRDGSIHLQVLLSSKSSTISNIIFREVFEFMFDLMIHRYGNYVFQKLIEYADERQLQMIIQKLTVPCNYIYYASIHKYGIFSIKKLIIVLRESELVTSVIKSLSDQFGNLMTCPTGWYVIMECLDVLDCRTNDPLYVRAIEECLNLSRHKQGAVSMNGLIARIQGPRRFQLLDLICVHARFLAHNPIGNSVVQCVIGLQSTLINDQIFGLLDGCYVRLSMLKTGSRLVQQCLRTCAMDRVIHEFLRSDEFAMVAIARYGHHVVQTALKESQDRNIDLHGSLVLKVEQHLNCLQRGYGPNILRFLKSIHCHL